MSQSLTLETLPTLPSSPARYGVLGFPVAHSLSPQLQLAAFEKKGRKAQYVKIEIPNDRMPEAVALLKKMDFQGWNCTVPHKISMMKLVDQVDETATRLKAVNTVLREGDRLIGFNTDGLGWVRAIREEFSVDVKNLRIMILGCGGGAGQALARQAAMERCERLVLVNRTFDKAKALEQELASFFVTERLVGALEPVVAIPWEEEVISEQLKGVDLVVNCSSVGLKSYDPAVLPARILPPHLLVYDTIYRPARTKLLESAIEAGARVGNGLSMLLHQGALAFEIWTGETAPLHEMRQALQAAAAATPGAA